MTVKALLFQSDMWKHFFREISWPVKSDYGLIFRRCHGKYQRLPNDYLINTTMPATCVITLNWNNAKDTIRCLRSLLAADSVPDTIVACDNGSEAASVEQIWAWAKENFPEADRLRLGRKEAEAYEGRKLPRFVLALNDENLGFSAGNNTGIRLAAASKAFDFIWLLNNDAFVLSDSYQELLACTRERHGTGIFGSTIVRAGRDTVECAGGYRYSPTTTVIRPAHGGKPLNTVLYEQESPLDYISGACMFIRAEVFGEVGLLNEDYFLYYEELDFCRRAQKAGFDIAWCRDSVVKHIGCGSLGGRESMDRDKLAMANYHENLSTLKFTRRFYPELLGPAAIFRFFGKAAAILLRRDFHLYQPLLRAFKDFFRLSTAKA